MLKSAVTRTLLPAGFLAIGQREPDGLDFIDLALFYFINSIAGRLNAPWHEALLIVFPFGALKSYSFSELSWQNIEKPTARPFCSSAISTRRFRISVIYENVSVLSCASQVLGIDPRAARSFIIFSISGVILGAAVPVPAVTATGTNVIKTRYGGDFTSDCSAKRRDYGRESVERILKRKTHVVSGT